MADFYSSDLVGDLDMETNKPRLINGEPWCPVSEDWPIHRMESKLSMSQIEAMHERLDAIAANTTHLEKLDPITNTLKLFTFMIAGAILLAVAFAAVISGKDINLSKDGITTHSQ